MQETRTTVVFEAPSRVRATLSDLLAACGPLREVAVARELTKLFEEVKRGTATELAEWAAGGVKGEIVLVIEGAAPVAASLDDGVTQVLALVASGTRLKDAAAEVADDLLRRCRGLRVLATSREGLRVGGEVIWPVPPLGPGDAVELFLARARAAGAPPAPSDEARAGIDDICTRLDGLPLAIELAAARTRAFPISEISARLNDRFKLLTGGSRTSLPRQQTLRAAIDWSVGLLDERQRIFFARLGVVAGTLDLETAGAITASEPAETLSVLTALVRHSMIAVVGDDRYRLLDTLRAYALQTLEALDADDVRDRHAGRLSDTANRSGRWRRRRAPAARSSQGRE